MKFKDLLPRGSTPAATAAACVGFVVGNALIVLSHGGIRQLGTMEGQLAGLWGAALAVSCMTCVDSIISMGRGRRRLKRFHVFVTKCETIEVLDSELARLLSRDVNVLLLDESLSNDEIFVALKRLHGLVHTALAPSKEPDARLVAGHSDPELVRVTEQGLL